jgi:diguanylate cyclase (GGDEF)-like protein
MKRSALRVVAIPALLLICFVAASSVGYATFFKDRALVRQSQNAFEATSDLARVSSVLLATHETYLEYWRAELGHQANPEAAVKKLQERSSVQATNSRTTELFKTISKDLEHAMSLESSKDRLGAIHEIQITVEKFWSKELDTVGSDGAASHELGNAYNEIMGNYFFLQAKRVAVGVDEQPKIVDLQQYLVGMVASEGSEGSELKSLGELMTVRVPKGDARSKVLKISGSKELQPFADELAWSLKPGLAPASHVAFDVLDANQRLFTERLNSVLSVEARRVESESLADLTRHRTSLSRLQLFSNVMMICAVLTLVGLLVRLNRRLTQWQVLAETDSLTGSLNRAGLRRLSESWFHDRAKISRVSVAVIDLDRFKSINDEYGHEGGDLILRSVITAMKSTTINDSTAIARWGGDEFVAVFNFHNGLREYDLDNVMERMHQRISTPIEVNGELVAVTSTMGIATCTCGSCDFDDLFRTADHALYAGKFEGRNRWNSVSCSFDISEGIVDRMNASTLNEVSESSEVSPSAS